MRPAAEDDANPHALDGATPAGGAGVRHATRQSGAPLDVRELFEWRC